MRINAFLCLQKKQNSKKHMQQQQPAKTETYHSNKGNNNGIFLEFRPEMYRKGCILVRRYFSVKSMMAAI